MTKDDLVKKISKKTALTESDVEKVINSFMEVVKNKTASGEAIYMRTFGTFAAKTRKAKVGRDIGRGTAIDIPATSVPTFKPAREFKNSVKTLNSKK